MSVCVRFRVFLVLGPLWIIVTIKKLMIRRGLLTEGVLGVFYWYDDSRISLLGALIHLPYSLSLAAMEAGEESTFKLGDIASFTKELAKKDLSKGLTHSLNDRFGIALGPLPAVDYLV